MSTELSIVPLGGLNEIGLNCMAVEYDNSILVIDAGLMFPDASTMPGVDLVIPDFSWITERAERVKGLVLTHGHEDHIGAVGYLMRELPPEVPVFGTRLTLAMTAEKLREWQAGSLNLVEIQPRQKVMAGPFELDFMRVNHSIPDGVAVAVNTPLGTIIHTGDFRIDPASSEERMDLYKFAEYGEKGILALLADSTNADMPGTTTSEVVVRKTLEKLFANSAGRVIVACFASSLVRIRQVAEAAKAAGRKVVFDGRGMVNIVKLAKSLGYLTIDDEDEADWAEAADLPDDKLVIVATGSQGEPMSALSRMANGEHKKIAIQEGDTVVFSARFIPGHERDISHLIDQFYRQGAKVMDGRRLKVHTSGHAQAEEIKLMLNLTRPKHFIPVHGETSKLVRNGELAMGLGWPAEQVWVLENGLPLVFDENGSAYHGERVTCGRKLVDGNRLGEPEDPVLRSRLKLAGGGLVVVTVVLTDEGVLAAPPLAALSGVHYESDMDLTLETEAVARRTVVSWRSEKEPGAGLDIESLSAMLQRDVRQLFRHSISRRPTVWPQIIVLEPAFTLAG